MLLIGLRRNKTHIFLFLQSLEESTRNWQHWLSLRKGRRGCGQDGFNIMAQRLCDLLSVFSCPVAFSSPQEEEEAGFTGRRMNSKMQVYSGSKCAYLPKMMTLHQQCIRVLKNNIDCKSPPLSALCHTETSPLTGLAAIQCSHLWFLCSNL